MAHTKEPWLFQYDHDYTQDEVNGYYVQGADGREIFYRDNDDRPETWGDLKRATECVNALAGYNPDAVADVVAALEEIARFGKENPGHGFSCATKAEEALTRLRSIDNA